jgi:transposase
LFDEAESLMEKEQATADLEEESETINYQRKKPVRKPLPKNLPREEIIHDVEPEEKQCDCGCEKQRIGEEVSEQLEVIPASIKVVAHVRPKYACNRCDNEVAIATIIPAKAYCKFKPCGLYHHQQIPGPLTTVSTRADVETP